MKHSFEWEGMMSRGMLNLVAEDSDAQNKLAEIADQFIGAHKAHLPEWWHWLVSIPKNLVPQIIIAWLILVFLNEVYKEFLKIHNIPAKVVSFLSKWFFPYETPYHTIKISIVIMMTLISGLILFIGYFALGISTFLLAAFIDIMWGMIFGW